MLSELKKKQKVIGVKQSLKAVHAGRAQRVYIAEDADPELLEPIRAACGSDVEIMPVQSMAALGHACEIDVGASVAVVLKDDPQ